jgi:hypothetical protein
MGRCDRAGASPASGGESTLGGRRSPPLNTKTPTKEDT